MVKRFVRLRTDRNTEEPENHRSMKSHLCLSWRASGVAGKSLSSEELPFIKTGGSEYRLIARENHSKY